MHLQEKCFSLIRCRLQQTGCKWDQWERNRRGDVPGCHRPLFPHKDHRHAHLKLDVTFLSIALLKSGNTLNAERVVGVFIHLYRKLNVDRKNNVWDCFQTAAAMLWIGAIWAYLACCLDSGLNMNKIAFPKLTDLSRTTWKVCLCSGGTGRWGNKGEENKASLLGWSKFKRGPE